MEMEALAPFAESSNLVIGGFGGAVILYVLLGLIFKTVGPGLKDRFKPLIAVLCGLGLGLLALLYSGDGWAARVVIDYCVQGVMTGATAVGLYEVQRMAVRPR